MKRLLIGGLAALAISLTGAAPAQADDDMHRDVGFIAGEMILQKYGSLIVTTPLKLQQWCHGYYQVDRVAALNQSGVSLSKSDYLAGCYEAVGQWRS